MSPLTTLSNLSTRGLIEHIVQRHHRPLDEELPRLFALAQRVADVHGGRLNLAVRDHYLALEEELVPHMQKEEGVLFPMLLSDDPRAPVTIKGMRADHELLDEILCELRRLTSDYAPPAEACGTWRSLWRGLEALELDLHAHHHLEDSVLFPRAAPR